MINYFLSSPCRVVSAKIQGFENMKQYTNKFLEKIPFVVEIINFFYQRYQYLKLSGKSTKDVFTEIYDTNTWGDEESRSGAGSNLEETRRVRKELPELIEEYAISSMLDIPCGDFHWMKDVPIKELLYTGADIVPDIIRGNSKYENSLIKFKQLNLIEDKLPMVDLVFVRDCLVHLSYSDIQKSLHNICSSGSKYLLTTTFIDLQKNRDIATGQWREINLQEEPFSFPRPLTIINEDHPEARWKDKSLALWNVKDLKLIIK